MRRPSEIDSALKAAARQPLSEPHQAATDQQRGVPRGPSQPGARRVQSLPSDPSASGTGINHWWRYQEKSIPGGGHLMVNVGTGNVVLQDDDMSVPHQGIAMAFRRTYNSQMPAVVPGNWTNWQSLYGLGWTNTFDAHIVATSATRKSVYDIDGTRYDYVSNGNGYSSLTPGQHAVLAWDGACGMTWTKKSGTTYYFYISNPSGSCSTMSSIGGYAGRLFQIIGRNRNRYITFNYSWDNGDASVNGKISQITATTESGMTATLAFADFSGRRLLQQLTYPDGATTVQYAYDANGNLTSVSRPPNNAAGIRPNHGYGYQTIGSDTILYWAASPRVMAACGTAAGCYSDGAGFYLGFAGTSAAASTLTSIQDEALVNPTIPDGVSTGPIQGAAYPTSIFAYDTEYYSTGVTTPTFRDTAGHMTNWVVDGLGRPTQTQQCTASVNQGQQCTGTWLVSTETWDAADNLVAQTDQRGYETDYAYDANGNAIAVALPQVTTAQQGTFRPTSLMSYDALNNVTAYCDPDATHALGLDWSTPPAASDQLCPQVGSATRVAYAYPSYEPSGEVAVLTSPATAAAPSGYRRTFTYASAPSTDYGLPMSITGDVVTQPGTAPQTSDSYQPVQTFTYDQQGNAICYGNGVGTWLLLYDALGRKIIEADPDDSSVPGCGKPSSGKATASYYTYFPSGDPATEENPLERAADVAAGSTAAAHSFTYDLDGNVASETHHYGCATISGCTAGVTNKWYDGAGRLVEVAQPHDPKFDIHTYRWLVRYLYDITAGGSLALSLPSSSSGPAVSTAAFGAYGNLYDTQTWIDLGWSTDDSAPRWVDHLGTAYDALDRKTASYDVAIGSAPMTTTAYDATLSTLGRQSSLTRASGETATNDYDAAGRLTSEMFSGDGGVTPSRAYSYTGSGRISAINSSLGTESFTYDAAARVLTHTEPAAAGGNTLTYGYASNGLKTSLTAGGAIGKQLFQYNYRHDGRLANEYVNGNSGWKQLGWTYTASGKLLQRTDPTTGLAVIEPASPPPAANAPTRTGYSSVFGPLTYNLDAHDSISAVTYSDGYRINNVATDLEGGRSGEFDSYIYDPASNHSTSSHNSTGITYTVRNEVGAIGPTITGTNYTYNQYTVWQQGNGIRNASGYDAQYNLPHSFPLASSGPDFSTPLNPLDGYELSGTGYTTGSNANYTNNVVYDAAGRLTSNDVQECGIDSYANPYMSEVLTQNTYDAENHTVSTVTSRTDGPGCNFGPPWPSQYTWSYNWGTNGHPYKIGYTFNTTGSSSSRYLHWDGDTLLYTSQTPSGSADDIKIGTDGDLTTADDNITIYDRDTGGDVIDAHAVQAQGYGGTSSTAYNDAGNGAAGSSQKLASVYITEPNPETIAAPFGTAIQGARAVSDSGAHWTTPDAFSGLPSDPASQMPFMYERNNSYSYADPSGYCAEDLCVVEGTAVVGGVALGVAEVAELAGDVALATSIRGGVAAGTRASWRLLETAGGWVKGTFRNAAGRLRIPDHLDAVTKELGEAKDVLYQHLSSQIRDDIAYVESHEGYTLVLRLRGGMNPTKLSKPLKRVLDDLIARGKARIEWGPPEDIHP